MLISNVIMLCAVVDKIPSFVTIWGKRASQLWASRSQQADLAFGTVVVAAISVPLWFLYSSHMLSESMGRVWAGGSCWADLPIHSEPARCSSAAAPLHTAPPPRTPHPTPAAVHVAESFLEGRNQDVSWGQMHSPVFAGEKMVYPFLPGACLAPLAAAAVAGAAPRTLGRPPPCRLPRGRHEEAGRLAPGGLPLPR